MTIISARDASVSEIGIFPENLTLVLQARVEYQLDLQPFKRPDEEDYQKVRTTSGPKKTTFKHIWKRFRERLSGWVGLKRIYPFKMNIFIWILGLWILDIQ